MSATCDFVLQNDNCYHCVVTNLKIVTPNTKIHEFKADSLRINKLIIHDQDIHYFPKDLPLFFPNLKELSIVNCKLKSITKDDLEGFDKLVRLDLSNNCLTYLPDDLFKHVPQLKVVSLRNNNIKLKFLEPLKNLAILDIKENNMIKFET